MHSSDFRARLDMLSATIPSAERRRTARGVMRTCRELGDHIRRARQLHALATTDAAREAVDRLVAEIEQRRVQLAQGARLSVQVRADRDARRAGRGWLPHALSGENPSLRGP